jgi:hypothetical protein
MFVDGWKIGCGEKKITRRSEVDLVLLLCPYSTKRIFSCVSSLFQWYSKYQRSSYVAGSGKKESSKSSQDSRPLLGGSSLKSRGSSGAQKKMVKWSERGWISFVMS